MVSTKETDITETPLRAARDRRIPALVALITLVGLALRLWGIGWSLPDARHPLTTYHPDELVNLNAALKVDILHGQFDIEFYSYGAFYSYLVSFAHTLGRGWGVIPTTPADTSGSAPSETAQLVRMAPEQAGLFLAGRLVTALLGAATLPLLFALGSRLFGKKAGLAAATLYAVAPLAVVHAHFLTVDVPATFFVTLALLWAARLLDVYQTPVCHLPQAGSGASSGTSKEELRAWRDYALAGVWCGVAAATKYPAGIVLIAPVLAHFLNRKPEACPRHRAAHFVVLLAVTMLTFLIACPGPILNLKSFGNGVYYELVVHSRRGHGDLFLETGPGWWYHLIVSLRYGLGTPLLLLGLAGLGLACVRRTRQDWILLAFFAAYYLSASFSAVRFSRYILPLFPVLCLFGGRLLAEPFPQRALRQAITAAGALVFLVTLGLSTRHVRAMTLPDPRDVAADYLEKNAPQGASVAFAKIPWFFSPPLSPWFGAIAPPVRARAAAETTRYQLRFSATEWDTSVLSPPPDFVVLCDFETANAVERLHLPAPTQFVQAVPASYRRLVFSTDASGVEIPSYRPDAQLPEDLRYILPTILLYQKPAAP